MKKLALCILLAACGTEVREVEKVVEVPGPEVIVPVPTPYTPEVPPVTCQIWTSLSNPALSQTAGTSQYLALVNSVKGDLEIGLQNLTLTNQPDDTLPFDEFVDTEAETITSNFSMRCQFLFEVTVSGNHVFTIDSDDGSQLFINGVRVIDNGGAHAIVSKSATVNLPVGIHSMRVLYYEGSGPKALSVKVQRPPVSEQL